MRQYKLSKRRKVLLAVSFIVWILLACIIAINFFEFSIGDLWQLVLVQVVVWLLYGFIVVIAYTQNIFTRKKTASIVGILFSITFLTILLLPANWFMGVPKLEYSIPAYNWEWSGFEQAGLPTFTSEVILKFSAIGSFSVNNPINVKITLTNVSISNLLSYYQGVTFNNAFDYPLQDNTYDTANTALIPLKQINATTYEGSATLVWLIDGPSTPVIVPYRSFYGRINPDENNTAITISSVSDTLSIQFSENTGKLTWLIGSFSIIALEPVLAEILVEKPQHTIPQTPPPSKRHQ